MVVVPALTPVTIPLPFIVATDGVLLLHDRPPPVLFVNEVVEPTHTLAVPPIADGNASTVNVTLR